MNSKLTKTHLIACALLLSSCGFGTKDADPLADREGTFVSAQEKASENDAWKLRCEAIEAQYQVSLGQHDVEVGRLNNAFASDLETNKAKYDNAVVKSEKDFKAIRDRFVADLENSNKQCMSIQDQLNGVISKQDAELKKYQAQSESFEAQNFNGMILTFDPINASPRSYTFVSGEEKTIEIHAGTGIPGAENAVSNFHFVTRIPGKKPKSGLPDGVNQPVRVKDTTTFTITGTPNVEIPNGKNQEIIEIDIIPQINYTTMSEANKALLRRELRTETISFIVTKTTAKPEILEITNRRNDDEIEYSIVVKDSGSNTTAPTLILSHVPGAGTASKAVLNGSALMTLSNQGENPKKTDKNVWTYTYVLHKTLIDDNDMNKTRVDATFKIQVQSQSTGLLSDKSSQSISLKGAQ